MKIPKKNRRCLKCPNQTPPALDPRRQQRTEQVTRQATVNLTVVRSMISTALASISSFVRRYGVVDLDFIEATCGGPHAGHGQLEELGLGQRLRHVEPCGLSESYKVGDWTIRSICPESENHGQ